MISGIEYRDDEVKEETSIPLSKKRQQIASTYNTRFSIDRALLSVNLFTGKSSSLLTGFDSGDADT